MSDKEIRKEAGRRCREKYGVLLAIVVLSKLPSFLSEPIAGFIEASALPLWVAKLASLLVSVAAFGLLYGGKRVFYEFASGKSHPSFKQLGFYYKEGRRWREITFLGILIFLPYLATLGAIDLAVGASEASSSRAVWAMMSLLLFYMVVLQTLVFPAFYCMLEGEGLGPRESFKQGLALGAKHFKEILKFHFVLMIPIVAVIYGILFVLLLLIGPNNFIYARGLFTEYGVLFMCLFEPYLSLASSLFVRQTLFAGALHADGAPGSQKKEGEK